MAVLSKGALFPSVVSKEIFNKVKGKSSLTKLSTQMPIAFNGTDVFTFSLDNDISIVAENGGKPHGGITVTSKKIVPIKVVYQARVSDEFKYAEEEAQLDILSGFTDGFSKKLASGLDKMAFHGVNPATGTASNSITSCFDTDVTNEVIYASATGGDSAVEAAVVLVGDNDVNGIAMSRAFAQILASETFGDTGQRKFPELAWGGQPESIRGLKCDINSTVGDVDYAIVGDFNAFRWGFAKDITFEMVEYGDPDNTGVDLKGTNQVMLRAEAYIGFAVIDPSAFAKVLPTPVAPPAQGT